MMTRHELRSEMARISYLLCFGLCGLALLPAASSAQIKIERSATGELVLSNDPRPASRSVRPRLVARRPNAEIEGLIQQYANKNRLEPDLVRAVIQVESAFDPRARSVKGAMGLMQLMPETAREVGVGNPWDPEENVRGGTIYLRRMLDRFGGQVDLALASYNAGPGAVERYGGVPPYRETLNYVDKVLRLVDGTGWEGKVGTKKVTPSRSQRPRPVLVQRDAKSQILLVTN